MTRMPALYIGHGAPPLLDDPVWSGQLRSLADDLPRPTAILIVSAHWESAPVSLSASGAPLVYDFGGFDPKYYRMTYETPDASALAARVAAMMPSTEPVHQHASRGLDHGAWLPLKVMYPDADIPVLQLSLPTSNASRLLALGERLRPLREQGVLVVGSGFMTHGLQYVDWSRPDVVPGWSKEFDLWAGDALHRGDVEELLHFRGRAPGLRYAHPSVEHFTPLFVTLGAATDPEVGVQTAIDGFVMGLAKRSFQVA